VKLIDLSEGNTKKQVYIPEKNSISIDIPSSKSGGNAGNAS
jgi:hypothetical protein